MSAREKITKDIVAQLKNMSKPSAVLISREFFEFEKLAITQFPAILVVGGNEERVDISMSERQATMDIELRCFVRGSELDTARNNLIENIEQTLELSRDRNITVDDTATHYVQSSINNIEIIERQQPLAQFNATLSVTYAYKRGNP